MIYEWLDGVPFVHFLSLALSVCLPIATLYSEAVQKDVIRLIWFFSSIINQNYNFRAHFLMCLTCNAVDVELPALKAHAMSIWVFEKERQRTTCSISIYTNWMMRDIQKIKMEKNEYRWWLITHSLQFKNTGDASNVNMDSKTCIRINSVFVCEFQNNDAFVLFLIMIWLLLLNKKVRKI